MRRRLTALIAPAALAVLLSASVVAAYEPIEDPALLGWWALDEGLGRVIADSSAHDRDGRFTGINPTYVPGARGTALQLGNGATVEIPAVDMVLSEATIAAWIKPDRVQPDWAAILTTSGSGLYLLRTSQVVYHWGGASSSYSYRGGPYLAQNEWSFVTLTIAPDGATFYLDGVASAVNPASHGPVLWDGAIHLGGDASSNLDAPRLTDAALDDVSLFSRALIPKEIVRIMRGLKLPGLAHDPYPSDEATDVPREAVLAWEPGQFASTHDMYLGTVFEDVAQARPADPRGVLVAADQPQTVYSPPVRLKLGQTYYWRVDEIGPPPGSSVFEGDVWSFTVEPELYPIEHVVAGASVSSDEGGGIDRTIDDSGLSKSGGHSTEPDAMWIGNPAPGEPVVLQYDFDRPYKLTQAQVWNFNYPHEPTLGFGLKEVTIAYANDANEWVVLGDFELDQASGQPTYTGQSLDLGPIAARAIRITAHSNYGGVRYGLSEIRFYRVPVLAREPLPAPGATNVPLAGLLSWRPGREAVSHEISFSTDAEAVGNDLALIDTVATATYALDSLELGTTYYWRVDEVNAAEPIARWRGNIWDFTTESYAVLDDFESYTDEEGHHIFETWIDGYGVATNGSVVGNSSPPYSEPEIVAGGAWSMPFNYNNSLDATVAETERTFDPPQDWTRCGIHRLAVHFYGTPGNTGSLYLNINGTKVPYPGAATDLNKAQWQTWVVDLSTVETDTTAVASLTLGVEGAGAAGKLYFDDIWLYVGNAESITPTPPDMTDLTLRYAFDEGAGPDVRDTSGSGHNGTLHGFPQWVSGAYGRALDFAGPSDYVDTEASLLDAAPAFTIACWLKADLSAANRRGLVGQNECIEFGAITPKTIEIWTSNGGSVDFPWPYRGNPLEWHHVAAVGDGAALTLYLDGKAIAAGGEPIDENGTGYGASPSTTTVGGGGIFDATGNSFVGSIDEVHVYRRALSAAEVAALAGRTAPFYPPL